MTEEKIQFAPHQSQEEKFIKPQKPVRGAGFASQEKPEAQAKKEKELLKSFEEKSQEKEKGGEMSKGMMFFISFIVVVWGFMTGFVLARNKGRLFPQKLQRTVGEGGVKKGMVVGVLDERTFRDTAEGKLGEGGINGEGSHHLVRPGGESQNVYLTSSIVDLDQFVDHEVKVWGETFSAQKAGWLMDVGKLEVLE